MTAHPGTQAAQTSAGTVSLRFTNSDMYDFADRMSEILGLTPLMVDPLVQGTVDINYTAQRDEVFTLFNGILKSKNAALVKQDKIYQIVPITVALRNNLEIIDSIYMALYQNKIKVPVDLLAIDLNRYNELNDKIGYIYKIIKEQGKVLYGTI